MTFNCESVVLRMLDIVQNYTFIFLPSIWKWEDNTCYKHVMCVCLCVYMYVHACVYIENLKKNP